jgi:hypothetical protein
MARTLTIRIEDGLDAWLEQAAQEHGISKAKFVRDQLELVRQGAGGRPFMRLAGAVSGPRDLSTRKRFSRR